MEIGYHSTTYILFLEAILAEDIVDIKAEEVRVKGVAKPIINTHLALSLYVITVAKAITTLRIAGLVKARERRNGKLVKIKELIVPRKVIVTIITLTTITLKDK